MRMFLLQQRREDANLGGCYCGMVAIAIVRAPSEEQARVIAAASNSSGTEITGVRWSDKRAVDCFEYPLLDGPMGMVASSWFPQHLAG